MGLHLLHATSHEDLPVFLERRRGHTVGPLKAEEIDAQRHGGLCVHRAVPSIRLMRPTLTSSALSCLQPPGCPKSPEQAQSTTRPAPPCSSGLYSNVTTSQRDPCLACISVPVCFAFFLAFVTTEHLCLHACCQRPLPKCDLAYVLSVGPSPSPSQVLGTQSMFYK